MSTVPDALLQLESMRCRALVAGDLAQVATCLSPALVYVHAPGTVHDLPQLMHFLREHVRYTAVERRGMSVQVDDRLAVMTGLMRLEATRLPTLQNFQATSFVTQVWTRDEQEWQLSLFQSTQIDAGRWDAAAP